MKKLIAVLALVLATSLVTLGAYADPSFDQKLKQAQQGDARSQYNLGVSYEEGKGIPHDYAEAVRWYYRSAQQGYANAQTAMGNMYTQGKGVAQDYAEAVRWYYRSAQQGDVEGQNNLGVMYALGEGGLTQDYVKAHMWANTAASLGDATATKFRDFVEKKMTAADISKAQQLARRCVQNSYKGC